MPYFIVNYYGVSAAGGSGYPLQVLVARSSLLWAFRYYPSRGFFDKLSKIQTIRFSYH